MEAALDGFNDSESHVKITRTIVRGSSPTTFRLERRIAELEDIADLEREARIRAERANAELNVQINTLMEHLDEAQSSYMTHNEAIKRKQIDNQKLKKDLEVATMHIESVEGSLRKRHQQQISEYQSEIEILTKTRAKLEKDKNALLLEVEAALSAAENANKGKAISDAKLDAAEGALARLKSHNAALQQQVNDLNAIKAKLTSENLEYCKVYTEMELQITTLTKSRNSYQSEIDSIKKSLDDETRSKELLMNQLNQLRLENDALAGRLEDENEQLTNAKGQLAKLQGDLHTIKSKYEKELMVKVEEVEEIKRRMTIRINELIDDADKAKARANNLEKIKTQLSAELRDAQADVETLAAENANLAARAKAAENANADLQKRLDDVTLELNSLRSTHNAMATEFARLKSTVGDLQDRNANLERENRLALEKLKEATDANRDLKRRLAELESAYSLAQSERDSLATALHELKEQMHELQAKYQSTHAALIQLKTDMEQRLREKDDELERLRATSHRTIEELTVQINQLEIKYKSDVSRLKKKFEASIAELEAQLDTASAANVNLSKEVKNLLMRLTEAEKLLEEEKRAHDAAEETLAISERRRVQLQGECEDYRGRVDALERAKKNAQNEAAEANAKAGDLALQLGSYANEKRRLEGDITNLTSDLEEANAGRNAAEERANRLAAEVARLAEELKLEQDNFKRAETMRKTLEIEVREISIKLEEAETGALRESRRTIVKLQTRIKEMEADFEAETRRSKEAAAHARKYERQFRELQQQTEEDRRMVLELQDLLDKTQAKMKHYKRQLEEAEDVSSASLNKFRKAQQQVEEAEHRADVAERNLTTRRVGSSIVRLGVSGSVVPISGLRSVSVLRESSSVSTSRSGRAFSTAR